MAYEDSAVRREQLIAATVKVISDLGVAKATTRRISEVAGVNLATMHYVFNSKEDLFASVMLETTRPENANAMGAVTSLPDGSGLRRGFIEMIKAFRRAVNEQPDLAIAQYELMCWAMRSSEANHLAADVTEAYLTAIQAQFERLATARERAVDLRVLARYAYMLVDGMYFQRLTIQSDITDDELEHLAGAMVSLARKV